MLHYVHYAILHTDDNFRYWLSTFFADNIMSSKNQDNDIDSFPFSEEYDESNSSNCDLEINYARNSDRVTGKKGDGKGRKEIPQRMNVQLIFGATLARCQH